MKLGQSPRKHVTLGAMGERRLQSESPGDPVDLQTPGKGSGRGVTRPNLEGDVGRVEGGCHSEMAHAIIHGVGLEEVRGACETPPGRRGLASEAGNIYLGWQQVCLKNRRDKDRGMVCLS